MLYEPRFTHTIRNQKIRWSTNNMSWMSLVNEQKHARHQHFCAVRNVPRGWMLSTRQEFLFHMLHDNGCVGESVLWKKRPHGFNSDTSDKEIDLKLNFFRSSSVMAGAGLHSCNTLTATSGFRLTPTLLRTTRRRERERASVHASRNWSVKILWKEALDWFLFDSLRFSYKPTTIRQES